ncbi:MAG: cupredoxin domain-containing protein [Sulfobacillus sp.]
MNKTKSLIRWGVVSMTAGSLVAIAAGCGSTTATPPTTPAVHPVVHVATMIETGKMLNKPGWPKYTNAFLTVHQGDTVVFTIKSYDDGTAPLSTDSPYDKVLGTVNGTELVNGKPVSLIADQNVAHTFTVPGLGLNIVVPAAPTGGTVTVQATFKVPKAGVYDWQCEAPCGTTASGWGGPMMTPGWMQGTVTVKA